MDRRSFLQSIPLGMLLGPRLLGSDWRAGVSPERAMQVAFELLKSTGPEQFAAQLDHQGLKQFRANVLEWGALAAYDGSETELLEVFGVPSVTALRELDAKEFFVAFWRGILRKAPLMEEVLPHLEIRTVGHVQEGERAHVVSRVRFRGSDCEWPKPTVTTLQASDTGWALVFGEELEGLQDVPRDPEKSLDLLLSLSATHRLVGLLADGPDRGYAVCQMRMSFERGGFARMWALPISREDEVWPMFSAANQDELQRFINNEYAVNSSK